MHIATRAWELAARTTRNVRRLWVTQGRTQPYPLFVGEFVDLYADVALHQVDEAFATAGFETPGGPTYADEWDANGMKLAPPPTLIPHLSQLSSNDSNEVWEFECVNCGAVTFIASAARASQRWDERIRRGPSQWASRPDKCFVCGTEAVELFIWRGHSSPVKVRARYRSLVPGTYWDQNWHRHSIRGGDAIPEDAWPHDNFQ